MKLSEAIRLGSMMKPQAFLTVFDEDDDSVCAMGAAWLAAGLLAEFKQTPLKADREKLVAERGWLQLCQTPSVCPECGKKLEHLAAPHLNDSHRWTRERIADWVETIEDAQEAAKPVQEVEVSQ